MVTSVLPDRDKIRLINLFPCIYNQINLFRISIRKPIDVDYTINLLKKLKNVKRTAFAGSGRNVDGYENIIKLILSGFNPDILQFNVLGDNFNPNTIKLNVNVPLEYIKIMCKLNPNYDGRNIENKFNLDELKDILDTYPDVKLPLILHSPSKPDLEKYGHRLHSLSIPFQFNEPDYILDTKLPNIKIFSFHNGPNSNIINNLNFLPKLTTINLDEISLKFTDSVVDKLLTLNYLEKFSFKNYTAEKMGENDLINFERLINKPSIKMFKITRPLGHLLSWKAINTFVNCERNDFIGLDVPGVVVERERESQ